MTGFLDRRQDMQIHPYMYTSAELSNPLITRVNTQTQLRSLPWVNGRPENRLRVSVSLARVDLMYLTAVRLLSWVTAYRRVQFTAAGGFYS